MRRKIQIFFPVWSTYEDEIDVDIPDEKDPDDWLYENESNLIENHHQCEHEDIANLIDLGYAGSKFIDLDNSILKLNKKEQ